MDPICHTLLGATLARTGLENKTRFGTATLIVAANLPDVDVLSYFWGPVVPYAFRRGITHGLPALVVLPVMLAILMLVVGRIRSGKSPPVALSFRWLLILAAAGVASHPTLDWLNNYGMRWLSPFSNDWSYGDTLFIIDVVAWTILGAGLGAALYAGRDNGLRRQGFATAALVALLAYIAMNFALTRTAERVTRHAVGNDQPIRLMASPVPLTPFARDIVLEYADEYRFASVAFRPDPVFLPRATVIGKGETRLLDLAGQTADGRRFLRWARFPYVVTRDLDGDRRVYIADARYVLDIDTPRMRGFGMVAIDLH